MKSLHIHTAHSLWKKILKKGDLAIDMTAGNGKDSLVLANLILESNNGYLHIFDIQEKALANTRALLNQHFNFSYMERVSFHHMSHENIDKVNLTVNPKLVVYNLGYLPSGDKKITTMTATTVNSLEIILKSFPSCTISITAYPGHEEGKREEKAILALIQRLTPECKSKYFRFSEKETAPSLFWIEKNPIESCL